MENKLLPEQSDFHGWATRTGLKCSDGRTIKQDAFKHNDGKIVPLVWNHQHDSPDYVVGRALLLNHADGVYTYGQFNDTPKGQLSKQLVEHGDIRSLSICANQLKQHGSDVIHGEIREVSLVLAGANPGAFIESIIKHGEACEDEAIIHSGEEYGIHHADEPAEIDDKKDDGADDKPAEKEEKPSDKKEDKSLKEILSTLNEEQREAVTAVVGMILEEQDDPDEDIKHNFEGGNPVKENAFEKTGAQGNELNHAEIMDAIKDSKRHGSMRESFLQHGIEQIDYLFPDHKNLDHAPIFIKRDTAWVSKVMKKVHHTPFSRIRSLFADITEDDARAKGYIKGNIKKEEFFGLIKRTTQPTTVYKKQKMHRDDIVDITDFDVVAWLKGEMRGMLDEELARAYLIGDGRDPSSDDKINEQNIRPIWTDDDLFTIKVSIDAATYNTADKRAKQFIRSVIKARKNYKGSGSPDLYTTEDMLTDCLLLEDNNGRMIYESIEKLARVLRVNEIVTVPVMEGASRSVDGNTHNLLGLIVNLNDYNVGADKGGAVNMFEDFDIDYNAEKYLIETRCSGALTVPYSAMAIEEIVKPAA